MIIERCYSEKTNSGLVKQESVRGERKELAQVMRDAVAVRRNDGFAGRKKDGKRLTSVVENKPYDFFSQKR